MIEETCLLTFPLSSCFNFLLTDKVTILHYCGFSLTNHVHVIVIYITKQNDDGMESWMFQVLFYIWLRGTPSKEWSSAPVQRTKEIHVLGYHIYLAV